MDIDRRNIKPGDEVTVRGWVQLTHLTRKVGKTVWVDFQTGEGLSMTVEVSPEDIITHTPKPLMFIEGDRVKGPHTAESILLAIAGDYGWLRCDGGCHHYSVKLSDLERR